MAEALDRLAGLTGRKKVGHLNEALRAYLEAERDFIDAVERGRADARAARMRDFAQSAAELKQRIDQHRMP